MRKLLFLLTLTGCGLWAGESPDLDAVVFDAQQQASEVAARVAAVEAALRGASQGQSVKFLVLFEDPEPGIRLTALQWLARRPETAQQALSAALADESSMLREAALGILQDRRMESGDLQELRDAIDRQDGDSVRRLLLRMPVTE